MLTASGIVILLTGAALFLWSAVRLRPVARTAELTHEPQRSRLRRGLRCHACFIAFFALAYVGLAVGLVLGRQIGGEPLLLAVLGLGAIFVALDVRIQSRFATEIENTLRGLLSVCAHCRRIRVREKESGDDKWQVMELFLMDTTDATFSHGICPDCWVEHYPQLAEEPEAERAAPAPN